MTQIGIQPSAQVLYAAALLDHADARLLAADERYRLAGDVCARGAQRHLEGIVRLHHALALIQSEAHEEAIALLEVARARMHEIGDHDRVALTFVAEAVAHATSEHRDDALGAWERACGVRHECELATRAVFAMTAAYLSEADDGMPFLRIAESVRNPEDPRVVTADRGIDVRLWAMMLEAIRTRAAHAPPPSRRRPIPGHRRTEHALTIEPNDASVSLPDGTTIDFSRRRGLLAVVLALAERASTHAAEQARLSVDELIEKAWPGEAVGTKAGRNRVRVAIARLRRLGLAQWILTDGDGYRLRRGDVPTRANAEGSVTLSG